MDARNLLYYWSALQKLAFAVKKCNVLLIHDREPWLGSEIHVVPTVVACLQGQLRISLGDKHVHDLEAGELVLIQAGCIHQHLESRHQSLAFGQGFRHHYSDIVLSGEGVARAGVHIQPYRQLMDQMFALSATERCEKAQEYLQLLLKDEQFEPQSVSPAAQEMYEFMRLNCSRQINIQDILAVSGLSRTRAFVVFKQAFGDSPHVVLTQRRCLLAQVYLRAGLSIADCAQKTGFQSRRHMCRAFQDLVGASPRKWLQNLRQ